MITFIVMPLDTIWNITVQWYAGEVPCKVLNFLKLFAMYSSALVLVVISLDRHTAILRPFSFTGASHRNRVMLAVAWTASILLASPQLFLFQLRTVEGVNFTQCIASGSFNERWKETLYNMFTFVTLYVTPLSVMIFCYARILWEIGHQANHGKGVTVSATNSSEPWKEPSFTAAAKLRVMLTFCFFLFAGYSNSAVLYSVARKGRKSHIRILILSLTIADLMITFIVMPLDTIWNITVQWYAGEVPCKVLNFLKLFAMYSSALVLVVISLDRHTAILRPFSFTGASHRNRVMLAVAWTASILLASPQLFLFQLRTVEGVNFTQCIASGSFNERWKETLYNMFTFVTLYVTPLSVMIFCYARILWEIGRQANHGKALTRSKNDHISKARLKTLKITIVIVVSFIVCWTPYYLLGLWYWFQPAIDQGLVRDSGTVASQVCFPYKIQYNTALCKVKNKTRELICTIHSSYNPLYKSTLKKCMFSI
ncbi:UNVERIFIED_CONTAM: hypothetical protein FKN15_049140 [Acipenser sinensis]